MNETPVLPFLFRHALRLMAPLVLLAVSGCASIVSHSEWDVRLSSNPLGATVQIADPAGSVLFSGTTPTQATLKSGNGYFVKGMYVCTFTKEGYSPVTEDLVAELNEWYWGNCLFGGLIGMAFVDPITGAMYKLKEEMFVTLMPTANAPAVRTSPVPRPADPAPVAQSPAIQPPVVQPVAPTPVKPAPPSPSPNGLPARVWERESIGVLALNAPALPADDVKALVAKLQAEIEQTGYFTVLPRAIVEAAPGVQSLPADNAFADPKRLSEIGKGLAVQKMIGGSIVKDGASYILSLRLFNVATGKSELITDRQQRDETETLSDLVHKGVLDIAGMYADKQPAGR